jgi:hypothetical protein
MNRPSLARAAAITLAVCLSLLPSLVLAQGAFDFSAPVQEISTGLLMTVRVGAAIIVLVGFIMLATRALGYGGAALIVLGLIGAARSEQIAQFLMNGI